MDRTGALKTLSLSYISVCEMFVDSSHKWFRNAGKHHCTKQKTWIWTPGSVNTGASDKQAVTKHSYSCV